jgi:hypothetical protein
MAGNQTVHSIVAVDLIQTKETFCCKKSSSMISTSDMINLVWKQNCVIGKTIFILYTKLHVIFYNSLQIIFCLIPVWITEKYF